MTSKEDITLKVGNLKQSFDDVEILLHKMLHESSEDMKTMEKYITKEKWMSEELKRLRPQVILLDKIKEWCATNCMDLEFSFAIEEIQVIIREDEMMLVCARCGNCLEGCHESNDDSDCYGNEENDYDPSDCYDDVREFAVLAKTCNYNNHTKHEFDEVNKT